MRRVAVLTSGGDAPGMNAAIRAVVRSGLKSGFQMYVVYEGYKGLIEDNMIEVDRNFVSDIINHGGTILKSARSREFKDPKVRKTAANNLLRRGIDSLIVIGGDGTYLGAEKLAAEGIATIAIPGTIDNDVASTDYTIGFDTCLNTICECVDKIRDTTASHQRCTIIEVMGNHCGDLALFSGIAEGVEVIVTPDHPLPEEEIVSILKNLKTGKKKHALVIVSEKVIPDLHAFAQRVTKETGVETRAEILGYIQRGGAPSAFDRILATRLGVAAINCLLDGLTGVAVGLVNNKIVHYDIAEALALPRNKHLPLLGIVKLVNK